MSDITTTAASKKIIQPTMRPITQKTSPPLAQQQEELPYTGSTDPIPPEQLKQVEQDLSQLHKQIPDQLQKYATALKAFNEQDLQQLKQELTHLSPKQLEDLLHQLEQHCSQLQANLTELKKRKKIDPEKADLLLDAIEAFSKKDLQNLSKEDRKNCNHALEALKGQVTELIHNKQLEPEVGNVLILFLAFAKAQMDQNDKAMLAGIQQTKVKTTELELQSEKQKEIAGQSTQGRHFSPTKAVILGVLAIAIGSVLAFFTGGASLALVGAGIGLIAGGVAVGTLAAVTDAKPDLPGASVVTDEGPDATITGKLQALLAYCNTQTQKLSSQLGSTQKLFVENTSDRSAQLGQQAGQAIADMGKIMEPK